MQRLVTWSSRGLLSICLFLSITSYVYADAQSDAAINNAITNASQGPVQINLLDVATLDLGDDYLFIAPDDAATIVNIPTRYNDADFLGMITSKDHQFSWYILVYYYHAGYVDVSDASTLNVDDLLNDLKKIRAVQNKIDSANGIKPAYIQGWIQEPYYDQNSHAVIWSVLANDGSQASLVNYNIYLLGREGYLGLVLTTTNADLSKNITNITNIAKAITFVSGKKYEEYAEGTSRLADYNVYGLITHSYSYSISMLASVVNFLMKIWFVVLIIPLLYLPRFLRWIKRLKK